MIKSELVRFTKGTFKARLPWPSYHEAWMPLIIFVDTIFGHVIMFVVHLQCKSLNIELERTSFNMPNTMITNKFMHFPNIMHENKNVTSCINNGLTIMHIWSIIVLNKSGVNSRTRKINTVVFM